LILLTTKHLQVVTAPSGATQRGNEIHFDLGWENRKRKTAFYRAGVIYVGSNNAQTATSLGKKDCEYVLTTLASCQRTCPSDDFMDMSVQRNFNSLEEKPAFKADNFFRLCKTGCNGTKIFVPTARNELCGLLTLDESDDQDHRPH
jgi:hypothetical protein